MSHKLSSALWDLDIDGPEREVLAALCYYADDDGTNCYPGMPLLIWKLGKSESQTQRVLKRLEGRGVVTIVQRGLGRGNGSEYILDLSKINPKENCPIKKPRIQAVKPTIQEIKPSIEEIKPPIQDTQKVASSTGTRLADSKEFLLPEKETDNRPLREQPENRDDAFMKAPVLAYLSHLDQAKICDPKNHRLQGYKLSIIDAEQIVRNVGSVELFNELLDFWLLNRYQMNNLGNILAAYREKLPQWTKEHPPVLDKTSVLENTGSTLFGVVKFPPGYKERVN